MGLSLGAVGLGTGIGERLAWAADSFNSAQSDLADAQRKFYKTVRDTPGEIDQKRIEAVAEKVLHPAEQQLSRALSDNFQSQMNEAKAKSKKRGPVPIGPFSDSKSEKSLAAGVDAKKVAKKVAKPVVEEAVSEPEIELDGSGVPKELVFPGKKNPLPSPSPALKPKAWR